MLRITHQHKDLPLGRVFYVDLDSGVEGPRTVVVGGIHGDESQARLAVATLPKVLAPRKGAVRIILNANPAAIAFSSRYSPREAGGHDEDLNRCFSKSEDFEEVAHARGILRIIRDFLPTFVLDVHETLPGSTHRTGFFLFEDPAYPVSELPTVERRNPTTTPFFRETLQGVLGDLGIPSVTVESYTGPFVEQVRGYLWVFGTLLHKHDPQINSAAVKYR